MLTTSPAIQISSEEEHVQPRRGLVAAIGRRCTDDLPLCGLSLAYWVSFAICFDPRVPKPDAIGYYAYAQSLLVDGNLSLFDEFAGWHVDPRFTQLTPLGHLNNMFACGTALLWLPFLAVLHGLLWLFKIFGSTHATDGYSTLYIGTAAFASAVYGYLGLVLSYRVACRYATSRAAARATLGIGFFSPLWYYVSIEGSMSHACSAFCTALFVYMLVPLLPNADKLVSQQEQPRGWLLLGLTGGLLSMVRWQEALLPAFVGIGLAVTVGRRRAPRAALAYYAMGLAVSFTPQMMFWQIQSGFPFAVPQGGQFFRPLTPAIGMVLFSSHHSLFVWTPVVLFAAFAGLRMLWSHNRTLALLMTLMFALQTYVNAIVIDPGAGASFGARRFLGLTPFFVVGLALLLERLPSALGTTIVGLCGLWTTALWLLFVHGWVDPIRYIDFQQLVSAVGKCAKLVWFDVSLLQPRRWQLLHGPLWLTLSLISLSALTASIATLSAFRIPVRPRVPRASTAITVGAGAVIAVTAFSVAAARTTPMPMPMLPAGKYGLYVFGSYTNARYDGNPFLPVEPAPGAFHLPARLQWGPVPFALRAPTRDSNSSPSSLTTCGLPLQSFTVSLTPSPTRALHFALCGLGALETGIPVLDLRIDTQGGVSIERTLRGGLEIWDLFSVAPPERTVHNALEGISGFTVPMVGAPIPQKLTVSSPLSSGVIQPCAAIFAVTQELAASETEIAASTYSPVDLTSVANADYSQNAFWPQAVLNYYPDLAPGILDVAGTPFLILNHAATPYGTTTLSTRAFGQRGVRLPLQGVRSTRLSLLIAMLESEPTSKHVADFAIEYERGPREVREIWNPDDVVGYMDPTPVKAASAWHGGGRQRLSLVTIALDGRRLPRYLWLIDRTQKEPSRLNSSVTVFAITQTLQEVPKAGPLSRQSD